jgi:hypothetical protein
MAAAGRACLEGVVMRVHRSTPLIAAVLVSLAASSARAEVPLSATAYAGLAFARPGVSSGGWVGLHCRVAPHWSLGAEGGYVVLSTAYYTPVVLPAFAPSPVVDAPERTMRNVSAVFRGRSAGPVRLHALLGVGYYELETRTHFTMGSDQVEHEALPGFGFALGVSGTGLVRPGFQLRWDEVIRPHNEYLDVFSFAVGLNLN